MSRNVSRRKVLNKEEMYENLFENRGVKEIVHFETPIFKRISEKELNSIQTFDYYWQDGDKFWRLAHKFFGDQRKWWIIASLNQKPSEFLLNPGDVIKIPLNVNIAIGVLS